MSLLTQILGSGNSFWLDFLSNGTDPNFLGWVVILLDKYWLVFLRGAGVTLFIAVIGTIIGFFIGLIAGVIRTIPVTKNDKLAKRILMKIVNFIITAYVEIFRGTPMIVQAMVIFYGLASLIGGSVVSNARTALAIFIVSINTGAYMAEIVRGGIVSIDNGQFEAAHAIGMGHFKTMIFVIIPQVVRNILPATGNEFVINIKDTSVLNVISVSELYFATKTIAGNFFSYFEAFSITCVIYFVMTFTITRILRVIERKIDGPDNYEMIAAKVKSPELSKEVPYAEHN